MAWFACSRTCADQDDRHRPRRRRALRLPRPARQRVPARWSGATHGAAPPLPQPEAAAQNGVPGAPVEAPVSGRPEILAGFLGVATRIVDLHRDDHELRILRLVVPDAPPGLRWHANRLVLAELDDLVVQLELELPREDEVDLLLRLVPVPVRALAARVLRHSPVGQRGLLGPDRVGDPAHLAGVVPQPVVHLVEPDDLV